MVETNKRSLLKTVSWRTIAIVISTVAAYLLTGSASVTLSLIGVTTVVKTVLYYMHERLWVNVRWGRQPGKVLWFTGFSGSGKTTITKELERVLKKQGKNVLTLDGDEVRKIFPNTGFSKEARNEHVKRIGYLAAMLAKSGTIVLCSFISPYKEARDKVRSMCENEFNEVFVNCPIEECIKRDPKGLYAKALAGEIKQFTGIDDPYEPPENPELVLKTDQHSVKECVTQVLKYLAGRK